MPPRTTIARLESWPTSYEDMRAELGRLAEGDVRSVMGYCDKDPLGGQSIVHGATCCVQAHANICRA